jgi:hypothetical protein
LAGGVVAVDEPKAAAFYKCLANQRRQTSAPVEAAQLELAPVGKHKPRAGEQVADCGRDQDFTRLRDAENARCGMDRDPSHLIALKFHLTCVDPGASGEAMGSGSVDHRRRATHRTRWAVEQDEEAISGGLRLASTEAPDLGAYSLIVFREQQPPVGVAEPVQRLGRPGQSSPRSALPQAACSRCRASSTSVCICLIKASFPAYFTWPRSLA